MDLAQATITGSNQNNLRVSYGDDKGLLVEFCDDVYSDEYASAKAGRPIYHTVPFISIIFPGDKTKRIYKPAKEADKQRFPMQWGAYEKGQVAVADGTPITEWLSLSKSQALELKHMGFWTVELLAAASDTQILNVPSGNVLRQGAQDFLKGHSKADKENAELKAENASMKERLTALEAKFNQPEQAESEKKPDMRLKENKIKSENGKE